MSGSSESSEFGAVSLHLLHTHVEQLIPAGMTTEVLQCIPLSVLCLKSDRRLELDLATVGLAGPDARHAVSNNDDDGQINVIKIRQLSFNTERPQFMTHFLPYTASTHVLSPRKRNLSLDEAEGFIAIDDNNRSHNVISSVNAAYFLQDRCSACGCELDSDKKVGHSCAFFCIAACQLEPSNLTKTVVAFVEFNLIATARECPTRNVPCVSVHVLSPSRMVAACYSVIDALQILLRAAVVGGGDGVVHNRETTIPLPCPTFLRKNMLQVDVTCLHTVISFYMKTAVPVGLGARKRAAICSILLAVGEYVLRSSVPKPMIVPFVPTSAETVVDTSKHCVWHPMRQIVQTLQASRIKSPPGCDVSHTAVQVAPLTKSGEKQEFLLFMSPFSTHGVEFASTFREWTAAHAQSLMGNELQKYATQGEPPRPGNVPLNELLYAVRCFFYTNQQNFYREDLQIADPLALVTNKQMEIELRFILLLFRKGLSRRHIEFDRKDICNVIGLQS